MVDNWGDWSFAFEQSGPYRVEVWIDDTYGHTTMAAYGLRHDGVDESLVLDQAAASEWAELGTFEFAAGGAQGLHLVDNTGEPYRQMVPIAFDAVRVTWAGGAIEDSGGATTGVDASGGSGGGEASASGGVATLEGGDVSGAPASGSDDGAALPPGRDAADRSGCACGGTATRSDAVWMLVALGLRRRRRPRRTGVAGGCIRHARTD
jgi:hypothetical protein